MKFIEKSFFASATTSLLSIVLLAYVFNEEKKLTILILGRTSFVGLYQIKYALSRGHKVYIFTKRKTKPNVNKEVLIMLNI